MTATGQAEVSCCGRELSAMAAQQEKEENSLTVENSDDDFYITFSHPMTKEHYISFVAYVTYDRIMLVKFYPEQSGEVRFPSMHRGKLYFACNQYGLWIKG